MRKTLCRALIVAPAVALSLFGAAQAGYVAETGAVKIVTPPASLHPGGSQSNTVLQTFAEKQQFTLTTAVKVDDTASGSFTSNASLVGGTIAVNTSVDSYIFHSDPVAANEIYAGSATFSTAILGVIVLSSSLGATDAQLGHLGTKYPTGDAGRGLELSTTEDSFTLSADKKTLTLHFYTHGNVDEVRVITAASAAVPEPGSAALVGLGAVIVGGVARRRRATAIA